VYKDEIIEMLQMSSKSQQMLRLARK